MTKPATKQPRRIPKPINNQRAHQRRELSAPIPVVDAVSGESMGALINITVEGLMLMCNQEVDTQQLYQIRLCLPNNTVTNETTATIEDSDIPSDLEIEMSVDCLWCRAEESQQRHWAGFQIVDATQRSIKLIEKLIRDHGL